MESSALSVFPLSMLRLKLKVPPYLRNRLDLLRVLCNIVKSFRIQCHCKPVDIFTKPFIYFTSVIKLKSISYQRVYISREKIKPFINSKFSLYFPNAVRRISAIFCGTFGNQSGSSHGWTRARSISYYLHGTTRRRHDMHHARPLPIHQPSFPPICPFRKYEEKMPKD